MVKKPDSSSTFDCMMCGKSIQITLAQDHLSLCCRKTYLLPIDSIEYDTQIQEHTHLVLENVHLVRRPFL